MAVWALIGFMGCGKSSIGRLVASFCALGGSPLREFASLTPPSLRDGSPASVPRVARPLGGNHQPTNQQAADRQIPFIDLDEEIERRCDQSIPEIFSSKGEAGFRAIERETLNNVLSAAPTDLLISLGGGTLTDEGSRELVKKNCKCIYLRARVETLAGNLREVGTEGRPMLAGANPDASTYAPDSLESRISAMMAVRGPIYEKAADIILDIDGLDYTDVARQIHSILKP